MTKTVRQIALLLGSKPDTLVKDKQRIRDVIKRQNIKTTKEGNKFVVTDDDAQTIIGILKHQLNTTDSEKESLLAQIKELKKQRESLANVLHKSNAEHRSEVNAKDEEIRRLNLKIEKYADDFKVLNDKQLQLNNQQQQLQARILAQTKELKESQQKLLDSAERSNELQDKVDKMNNASLWRRITRHFE